MRQPGVAALARSAFGASQVGGQRAAEAGAAARMDLLEESVWPIGEMQ